MRNSRKKPIKKKVCKKNYSFVGQKSHKQKKDVFDNNPTFPTLSEGVIKNHFTGKRSTAERLGMSELGTTDEGQYLSALKHSLHEFVTKNNYGFNGRVKIIENPYKLLHNFNSSIFFQRDYYYVPYFLKQRDYNNIQACIKNPIKVNRYKYEEPIYNFANVVTFRGHDFCMKNDGQYIKTDTQFYLSQDNKAMFAKVVYLRYAPTKHSYPYQSTPLTQECKLALNNANEEEQAYLLQSSIFDRTASITMHVLLEGDPKKASVFMRFDSCEDPAHENIWYANDKRREIFGDFASSPHFHFQNERDSIVCLRTIENKKRRVKFKTGRSNAIDCEHLADYLYKLDSLDLVKDKENELLKQSYGMPFLRIKKLDQPLKIDLEEIVNGFLKGLTKEERAKMSNVEMWLDNLYLSRTMENSGGGICFANLIEALSFLDYISEQLRNLPKWSPGLTLNFRNSGKEAHLELTEDEIDFSIKRKLYSDLELSVANETMKAINLISENRLTKYPIDFDFDRDHLA